MKNRYSLTVFVLVCLGVSAIVSNIFLFKQPVRQQSDLTRHISSVLGNWYVVNESVPLESEYQGLETRDIIKRTYSNGNTYVNLIVAYIARSNRKSAHAQEACLRGSGAYVGAVTSTKLHNNSVQATSITVDHRDRSSLVYYWYKIGNTYTSQYLKSSFKMFLGGLVGKKGKGAALVRLSTPTESGRNIDAEARLEQFTGFLIPELEKWLP